MHEAIRRRGVRTGAPAGGARDRVPLWAHLSPYVPTRALHEPYTNPTRTRHAHYFGTTRATPSGRFHAVALGSLGYPCPPHAPSVPSCPSRHISRSLAGCHGPSREACPCLTISYPAAVEARARLCLGPWHPGNQPLSGGGSPRAAHPDSTRSARAMCPIRAQQGAQSCTPNDRT